MRAASAEARAAGVTRGMRRREAEARCPDAVCVDADEANEARTFEAVARAVEVFTPRVVLDRPGRCEFPTRGPSRYFGGDDALAERIREGVTGVLGPDGDDVRVGIADGVFVARLAARRSAVVPAGGSAAYVAPWPVSVLDDDDLASLLVRLGLPTLGAVAALAPDAVLARFGTAGRRVHDALPGHRPRADRARRPAARSRRAHRARPARGTGRRRRVRGEGARRPVARTARRARPRVHARARRGRDRARRAAHAVLAARPFGARRRAHRRRARGTGALAARRLDQHRRDDRRASPVSRSIPDEVVPADGRQLGFWGGDQVAHQRADRALARVQGMLGYDAVVTAVVQGGRTPAEQVRWVPWGEPREPELPLVVGTEIAAWPGALPPPFPARVFDPPVPAELRRRGGRRDRGERRGEQPRAPAHVRCRALPAGGGAVRAWAGPWAHDVRWWDGARAPARRALATGRRRQSRASSRSSADEQEWKRSTTDRQWRWRPVSTNR